MVTIESLKTLFSYDPETGIVTRLSTGSVFGSVNSKGYLVGAAGDHTISAHRIAFALTEGRWPKLIDHINRCKTDNRWANLREATPASNQLNRTGAKGVKSERNGRFSARFRKLHLGTFDTFDQARDCYVAALSEAQREAFGT